MEQGLMESRIMSNMPHGYFSLDLQWRFTYINYQAAAYLGRPPHALMGKVFWDVMPGIIGTPVERAYRKAMDFHTTQYIPMPAQAMDWPAGSLVIPSSNGIYVYLYHSGKAIRVGDVFSYLLDRKSFLLSLCDTIRSMTDPLDIQEAAAKSLGMQLGVSWVVCCDIMEMDGVAYFSLQGASRSMDDVAPTGLVPIQSLGKNAVECLKGHLCVVYDAVTDTRFEVYERDMAARFKVVSCIVVPLMKNGKLVSFLGVFHSTPRWWTPEEISLAEETAERAFAAVERANAELALRESREKALCLVKELEEADRNKNHFLGTISHELRNPLSALSVGMQLIESASDLGEASSAIDIMKRQLSQLCRLVDDLLDLTRINNNKIRLKQELVELNALVRLVMEDFKPVFDQKSIRLHFSPCSQPVYIQGDPIRLRQIIGNLLHNAQKFTNENGMTTISVVLEGNAAVISVEDDGIGIHEAILPKLFAPFVQAEDAVDRSNCGLGLGLSIVKSIARLHGGDACASSNGLGKGARFCIHLPLADAFMPQDEEAKHPKACQALKILLIEDSRNYAKLLGRLLTRDGHICVYASNGLKGADLAKTFMPDVIFCNISMPSMDGYQLTQKLALEPSLKPICFIALVGYASSVDIFRAKEAGFHMHLTKPLDMTAIRKVLSEIISSDNEIKEQGDGCFNEAVD